MRKTYLYQIEKYKPIEAWVCNLIITWNYNFPDKIVRLPCKLSDEIATKCGLKFIQENEPNNKETPYPYNLLNDVWENYDSFLATLSDDEITKLDKVMQEFGTRDYSILIWHYKNNASISEIAKRYNLSPSRIRQIIEVCCRTLRHPSRVKQYWNEYNDWYLTRHHNYMKCINIEGEN